MCTFFNYDNKKHYDISVKINSFVLRKKVEQLWPVQIQAHKSLLNTIFVGEQRHQKAIFRNKIILKV